MTLCTSSDAVFPACKSRKIEAGFSGGEISSDAGLLLVRQVDRKVGLIKQVARSINDPRRKKSCKHSLEHLFRQRVYGLVAGYEDLNDHNDLRNDLLLQTAVGRDERLADSSVLCRLENRMDREEAVQIHKVMIEQFIASFEKPPEELVLDFDATDNPVHGLQEGRFFHGYYDHYCFLPLYVFCGDQLLVAYLRESRIDGAKHAWAILSLLVKRLRQAWPKVRIIFRADGGFCRWKMLRWMDRHDVGYVVGKAKNDRLKALGESVQQEVQTAFEETGNKQQGFGEFLYKAATWDRERRTIIRAEYGNQGANPRFVVTNLEDEAEPLYREIYCARGEMENRIKEQMMLFSDRSSAHGWWTNQFRLLLSGLAYILLERLRSLALAGTELARADCRNLRLKLIKIGAVITRNTRRICVHLSSSYPRKDLFWQVASHFTPG